ncbi:ABC transporter permease subunit, partial [Cutibacterium granulosum]
MTDWTYLKPIYLESIGQTLFMALVTLLIGGLLGLVLGIFLYATRRNGVLANRPVNLVLNVIVNIIRPIPFIIFMTAIAPLTLKVIGTTIGVQAATFPLCIAATFAMSRIVEQNLVTVDPGVVEAARSMGTGPWRILFDVVVREALGPLILGYTYVLIA